MRRAPDSRGGSRYMWSLQPGARIEVSSPASLLEIDWSRKSYCLIAGGIGITPIIGIAGAMMRRNADITLHYAVKSRRDAAFLDELSDLLGERLIVHAATKPGGSTWTSTFARLPPDALAIICGPMRLLEAARHSWASAGRVPADLRYETFGSSGLSADEIVSGPDRSFRPGDHGWRKQIDAGCAQRGRVRGDVGLPTRRMRRLRDRRRCRGRRDRSSRCVLQRSPEEANGKICPCVSRAVGAITVNTLYRSDTR